MFVFFMTLHPRRRHSGLLISVLRISSFLIRDPEVTLEAYHVKIAQRVTRAIEMFEYFNGARIADP